MYFIVDATREKVKIFDTDSKSVEWLSTTLICDAVNNGLEVIGYDTSYRPRGNGEYKMHSDVTHTLNVRFEKSMSFKRGDYSAIIVSCDNENTGHLKLDNIGVCAKAIDSGGFVKRKLLHLGFYNYSFYQYNDYVSSLHEAFVTDVVLRYTVNFFHRRIDNCSRIKADLFETSGSSFMRSETVSLDGVTYRNNLFNFLRYAYGKHTNNKSIIDLYNPELEDCESNKLFSCPDTLDFEVVVIGDTVYFTDNNICLWVDKKLFDMDEDSLVSTRRAIVKLRMSNNIVGDYSFIDSETILIRKMERLVVRGDIKFKLVAGTSINELVIDCEDYYKCFETDRCRRINVNRLEISPSLVDSSKFSMYFLSRDIFFVIGTIVCPYSWFLNTRSDFLKWLSYSYRAGSSYDFWESSQGSEFCDKFLMGELKSLGISDIYKDESLSCSVFNSFQRYIKKFLSIDKCSEPIKSAIKNVDSFLPFSELCTDKISDKYLETIVDMYNVVKSYSDTTECDLGITTYYSYMECNFGLDGEHYYSPEYIKRIDLDNKTREFVIRYLYRLRDAVSDKVESSKAELLKKVKQPWLLTMVNSWLSDDLKEFKCNLGKEAIIFCGKYDISSSDVRRYLYLRFALNVLNSHISKL